MEDLETYRPLLFSIAYHMTGSASEAEDLVQESFLRFLNTSRGTIHSLKSLLTTIVVHVCLDYLKSARLEREHYIGVWLPEPVLTTDSALWPEASLEQKESLSLAFLLLLETLAPPERAIFLLHEVFDYPFQEIAQIVGKSPATCRQILHRAHQHLTARQRRFAASPEVHSHLLQHFLLACQMGDLAALTELLAKDSTAWADGGGKAKAILRPVFGQGAVARLILGVTRKLPPGLSGSIEEVNSAPALVAWNGSRLELVSMVDVSDHHIQNLYTVRNPDKLVFLQRQMAKHSP
jgi:RNA polymerase sigma-70 factor (ECF subfamily)